MGTPTTPLVAADIIIEMLDRPGRPIVMIQRKFPPLGWALPGGLVDIGESVESAAVREAREETCLDVQLVALLGLYSDPARDPRAHTATAAYIATAKGTPHGEDDAAHAECFGLDELPGPLVFDHPLILDDYREFRESGSVAPLRFS